MNRPKVALPLYLTTSEAASMLRITVRSLESMRARGKGPPFLRTSEHGGRGVVYRYNDIEDWLNANTKNRVESPSTSQINNSNTGTAN